MKKLVKIFCISTAFLMISAITVSAYHTATDWILSPEFVLDKPTSSSWYSLTSKDDTLRVGECYVEFMGGYLESYHDKTPHDFPIYLMDSDFGNSDDHLKTYEGIFDYNGKMPYVDYMGLGPYPSGEAVDSEGDDQGELYMYGTLKAVNQAELIKAEGRGASMFTFRISAD